MATEGALDNISASVPSLSETEHQLDRQQCGGSLGEAGVDADINDGPLPGKQEGIVIDGIKTGKLEARLMEYRRHATDEIEKNSDQDIPDDIIIPPYVRQSLPSAVETLLSRLECSSCEDPVRELKSDDLRAPGFGRLFGGTNDREFEETFGQRPKEWDRAVRLLIMRAAGNCNTLELIDFNNVSLSVQELKGLLDPLQASYVLRELNLLDTKVVNTRAGCKIIADYLKVNPSLRVLKVGKSYIRHYLTINGHPTLEYLDIGYHELKQEEILSIIQACPKLRRIYEMFWEITDEESAEMYSRFLMEHRSFCHVSVTGYAGPISKFFLSSCTGRRSVTLIGLEIKLQSMEWFPRNVLQPILMANRNLEDIRLRQFCTFSEEWQEMFSFLRQNGVLKHLWLVTIPFAEDEGFDVRAWKELVALVKEDSELQNLGIWKAGGIQHDLCSLIDAVTSDKSGIRTFDLGFFLLSANESRALSSMIQKNGRLQALTLEWLHIPLVWKEFFNSLHHNTTLKTLTLDANDTLNDQGLEALLAALRVNRILKEINLSMSYRRDRNIGKLDILKYALQEKERQGVVTYGFLSTSTEDKLGILRSLQQNAALQHLHLSFTASFDPMTWDELEALLRDNSTLESLTISGSGAREFQHDLHRLCKFITTNKKIGSLKVISLGFNAEESDGLARLINDNTSLKQVILVRVTGVHWETIFKSLRYNTALQTLEIRETDTLDGGAFKELMAALQVNSSLEKIGLDGTNWETEGKTALIREALEQKERRETYMATMRARLTQDELCLPTTGRLFLCGDPYAGKTQLRRALRQAAASRAEEEKPLYGCFPRYSDLRRTEGIEIELLNIKSLEISIWDLGGQIIFRALQDLLFPKLNLACVFLLLFSPVHKDSLKPSLSEKLHIELLRWLRFIASNSQIAGFILPQVKVVISHRDKILDHPPSSWAENVISNLRLQFAEILAIDEKIFCTDSMNIGQDVKDVLNHTVSSFEHLLTNKLFKVPATCLTLGTFLAKAGSYSRSPAKSELYKKRFRFLSPCPSLGRSLARIGFSSKSRAKSEPILTKLAFFELCRREIAVLGESDETVLTAVTEYLHDAGYIIQFSNSHLVVVDPNWFTFSFLGRLIGAGHKCEDPLIRMDPYMEQKDGHYSAPGFTKLLQNFAQVLRDEGCCGVDEVLLKIMMKEMGLCISVDASFYFAPTVFAEDKLKKSSDGERKLPDWSGGSNTEGIIYVGMRVQCRDQIRTSLTHSFFPRFQVYFRDHLISTRGLSADQIVCDYNMIHIIFEEFEVYVESDGNEGDHIDVLVRSSNSRSETLKFIESKVVKEIQDFCASPMGCPGVALVPGVLRTDCVRDLTLSAHRDQNQAIQIEDLKGKWREFILNWDISDNEILEEGKVENYRHWWPANQKQTLQGKMEDARDLITYGEYVDVLRSVKVKAESLEKEVEGLKNLEEEMEAKVNESSSNMQISVRDSASQVSGPSTSALRSQGPSLGTELPDQMSLLQQMQKGFLKLERRIDELHQDVKEVKYIMKEIHKDVKSVQGSQRVILATRVSINSKLDQLIGVTNWNAKEVPNRPYLTPTDVTWIHRISALVNVGKPMTLHFMCEERSESHLVKNQPGYPIIVSHENREWLRRISVISLNILWYLLRAGVHVAAGLGNVIPDLSVGEKTFALTASSIGMVLMDVGSTIIPKGNTVNSHDANMDRESWQYLKRLFAGDLKGKCTEKFLLHKVKYVRAVGPVESSIAWLCDECIQKGIRLKALECLD